MVSPAWARIFAAHAIAMISVAMMIEAADYKPYALQILAKQGILCQTEDGRFYLSEENFNELLEQKKLPL